MTKEFERCPICGKTVESRFIEIHHYIPESKGGTINDTMRVCGTCHDVIHFYIIIDDIEKYTTPDKLLEHNKIKQYVSWVADKNNPGHWKLKKVLRVMAS
jgi:hypothetical protein